MSSISGPPNAEWSRRGWPYSAANVSLSGKPTNGVHFWEAGSMSLRYLTLPAEKSAKSISSSGQVSFDPPMVVTIELRVGKLDFGGVRT